ncbi:MAG: molybdopterin-synthase adenylyltransferase MoeB [Thermoplasmata archaeon]|nr:molybdopterin-synthase adenylyltransferase MoeB [Thermoplasmata archaeon]
MSDSPKGTLVELPPSLRELLEEPPDEIRLVGTTVEEVLHALVDQFPVLQHHVFAPAGTLRTSVIVLVNDDDIRYRQRGRTPVGPKDRIVLVPALAGGAPAARRPRRRTAELSSEERHRYSRHLLLPEVGESGQRKLRRARVLLVGAGGLGSPAGLYLAAAGVGTIGIVDSDSVETSNLQRQVLYDVASVGRSKVTRATTRLRELNPHVRVVPHRVRLTSQNALRILRGYDVVVDGTDNFPTRYLVSDACALLGKPDVFGSVYRFEGQVSVFDARRGPCYRCLFPEPPPPELVPSCAEGGVLGVVPGLVGLCQATEVLKLILGIGEPLVGRLWLLDTLAGSSREVRVRKNPRCPVCGRHPTQRALIDYPAFCGVAGSSERVPEVTPLALARELEREHPPVLVDVREPGEWAIAHLPRARLVPKGSLAERVDGLPRRRPIVVYCKSGSRSATAVRFLLDHGFVDVRSLSGGIDRWAEQVEPTMPRY